MIYMVGGYGNNQQKNKSSNVICDFCKKPGHPMIKNGKPFCFKYKKKLRQEEKKAEKKDEDKDINSLFVNCVFTENNTKRAKQVSWLGDTGAQCHILTTDEKPKSSNESSVTMGNDSTSSVIRHEDVTIKNESNEEMILFDTHVVNGMNTNIISILQLVGEGWQSKILIKNSKKIIQVTKNDACFNFLEHKT